MNDATVIVINHHGMGQAEPELSHKLVKTFLNILDLDDRLPRAICFYAEGVKLAAGTAGSMKEIVEAQDAAAKVITL